MAPEFPYAGYSEPSQRRIRILFGNSKPVIVDTLKAKLVWQHPYFPFYFVPRADVKAKLTKVSKEYSEIPGLKTRFEKYTCESDGKTAQAHVAVSEEEGLKDYVRFNSAEMDAWFEEDDMINVRGHPKDPYKRIDCLHSSRRVQVKVNGAIMADTNGTGWVMLCETGLPARYYMPKTCIVNWNYITESRTTSFCPYKGSANYYSVRYNGEETRDIIWYYDYPLKEVLEVKDYICFYNEKVDIWIDGVKEDRPKSKFG